MKRVGFEGAKVAESILEDWNKKMAPNKVRQKSNKEEKLT
jgi:hypothetical protein